MGWETGSGTAVLEGWENFLSLLPAIIDEPLAPHLLSKAKPVVARFFLCQKLTANASPRLDWMRRE